MSYDIKVGKDDDPASVGCIGCVVFVLAAIVLWWIFFDDGFFHIINALNHIGS
jgi:hypothetical protein